MYKREKDRGRERCRRRRPSEVVDPVVVVAERDRWRSFPSSRGRRGGSGGASRRPRASPDRIGTWEREVAVILGVCAPTPLLFFIARATGAHQPYELDTPDQGVIKRHGLIFGSGPWRSTPTFSPLISHCSYFCSVSELVHLIADQCIGRASS